MAIKVPGSLGGLQYLTEQSYGITPTGVDFSYLGFFDTFKGTGGPKIEENTADGSRAYATITDTIRDASYTGTLALYRITDAYDWAEILDMVYNPTGDIPSFTTLVKYASDQYGMFKGCKFDSVTIKANSVGEAITADVDVKAMSSLLQQSTKAAFGPTLGDENEGPDKNTIVYNAYPTSTLTGEGATIKAKSFSIKVSNGLKPQEGIVDGVAYAAGNGQIPDKQEIEIEYTVTSVSKYWDNLKASVTDGFSITHVIGGHTLLFSGCYLVPDEHPSRSQTTYDETIRIRANSMAVE